MAQRRIKSIMHGSAEDTRVYHHEHRSTKTRSKDYRRDRAHRLMAKEFAEKRERRRNKFKRNSYPQ